MASSGVPVGLEMVVPRPRSEVIQRLTMTLGTNQGGYFDGQMIVSDSTSTIVITRKFVPTWAIVCAIVGFLFLLLGLLFLLVRTTESCQLTLVDVPGGTLIRAGGALSPTGYSALQMALHGLQS